MCDLNTRITRKKDLLTANVNLFDILHLWLPPLTKIYLLHGIQLIMAAWNQQPTKMLWVTHLSEVSLFIHLYDSFFSNCVFSPNPNIKFSHILLI